MRANGGSSRNFLLPTRLKHQGRPSSKYQVQHLRERIAKLEEALSAKDGELGACNSASHNNVDASSSQHNGLESFSGTGGHINQGYHSCLVNSGASAPRRPSLPPNPQPMPCPSPPSLRPGVVGGEDSVDTDTTEFGREAVLKKFSGWNGHFRIDDDGRTRYYGATSDHHTSYESEASPESQGLVSSASNPGVLSGYSKLQDHLLELFWEHPHPFLRLPDREAFMAGLQRGSRTRYFSPFLLNCVLLRSLHLSDNALAKRIEDGLFERVREHLFHELERPDHNTVLGLLFLSTYISGQLKHGLGWIYVGWFLHGAAYTPLEANADTGIACRLVVALGLHQDSRSLLETGRIARKELDYRHMIFWAAFVNDRYDKIALAQSAADEG